ncbi:MULTISPECIES: hypothetical protein [unclassified Spirosoma]|uniref:hypothetical protein n=1 Tax=unclassified Spirosoma TaxID=2621999 RepID=UPI000967B827|nr:MULTISPECIES: hypothetical protein [unclassified Spirosoma]MBN8824412.1 hypothetical protein [Spirosoma sp.]OJW70126.1 MAG: hypothetical protein BGO59_25980 [Spirosoma sp. 48-14]
MPAAYKLLKDLPNVKAGAIFLRVPKDPEKAARVYPNFGKGQYSNNSYFYCKSNFNYVLVWDILNNNPDWFEPVPDFDQADIAKFLTHLQVKHGMNYSNLLSVFEQWANENGFYVSF